MICGTKFSVQRLGIRKLKRGLKYNVPEWVGACEKAAVETIFYEEKSAEIVDGSQPPEEARNRTNIEYWTTGGDKHGGAPILVGLARLYC